MDTSDIIALGSLIVAVIALVFSLFADKRSKKMDILLKQKELDKKNQEEDDAKKADVEVSKVETPKGMADFLRLYNKGLSEARNVSFTIVSESDENIALRVPKDYLPFPKLLPQQNFDVYYSNFSKKPHQTIVITWDDNYAKERSKEMIIDM